jgi:hypothetical protein
MRQMLYKAPIGTPKTELSNAPHTICENSEQFKEAVAAGYVTLDEIVSGSLEAHTEEKPRRGRPRKVAQ